MKTQQPSGARVAKGASYIFVQGIVTNISSLVFLIIAARVLSVTDIGVVSALGMISTLFMTIGTVAIPSGATKYISEYMGKRKPHVVKDICRKTLALGALVSVLVSLACLALSATISQFVIGDSSLQQIIFVLAFDIAVVTFNSFLSGMLFGLQKFHIIALVNMIVSTLRLIGSVFFVVAGLGLLGVVSGWIMGNFLGSFLLLFFVMSSFGRGKSSEKFPFINLFRYSLPLYGATLVAYFSTTIDRLVILFFSDLTVLGLYSTVMAAVSAVGIVASSMSSSLFPQLSQLQGSHGVDALKEASVKASKYVFLIYIPVTVGLASVAYPTIQLFFGESYASGWLPLAIILIVVAVTSASVVMSNLLLSLGMTRAIFEANILAAAVGAFLASIFVVSQGSVGAALGRAALISVAFAYVLYKLKSSFGLHIDISAFKKSLMCSGTMAVGVIIAQLLLNNKYMLPFYIALGSIIYVLMLRFLKAVNDQDIQLLRGIFPNRFHRFFNMFARFLSRGD